MCSGSRAEKQIMIDMCMKILNGIGLLFLGTSSLFSQSRVVYGILTAFDQYPVANIEVRAKRSGSVAMTDSTGIFSLVCEDKDVIKIRPKTFRAESVKVDGSTDTVRVNLVFIDTRKNREIAIGYGHINEEDLSFGVHNLQHQHNVFCNYANTYELIRGRFPEMAVSGTLGNYKVYLRTVQSIQFETEALYVVDGVIVSTLEGIHPCDIRSINILKDAAASIYGAEGAAGVVLIHTKRFDE